LKHVKLKQETKESSTSSPPSSSSPSSSDKPPEKFEQKPEEMSASLRKALGIGERDEEFFQMGVQFFDVSTMCVEETSRAPARQKLWGWMVRALEGPPNKTPPSVGVFHYSCFACCTV